MSHFSSDYTDPHGRASGDRALRVVVHDCGGHPFQVQLSRELARRGMDVLLPHCDSIWTGKGAVDDADAEGLRVEGVVLSKNDSANSRSCHERERGR
jgi:hypothetical protein